MAIERKGIFGWCIIFLVVFLAVVVRFVRLDKVPSAVYYDEIDMGYQIRSLLTTGRDYRNGLSPFYFRSFNTDKTPLPIYFSVIPSLLFQSPEYQVRAGAALAGVLCVVLAMYLVYQLTGKRLAVIVTGLVFAFSPWQIQFSRMAFEAIFMLMIFMASISIFLYWYKTKKLWAFYLSALLLGLNVYTYRVMSLFAPLTVMILLAIYFKDFWKEGLKRIFIWLFIFSALFLPFMYATTIGSADQTRIGQISIFSDPSIPIKVMRDREAASNDFNNPEIGKRPVWWSFIFHNKVVSYVTFFGHNYYKTFSSDFLFLTGDPNGRHSAKDTGIMLFVDVIGLIVGLLVVIKKIKDKNYQLLLALLLLTPIPADLTMDGANHASRLIIMAAPLLLIVGLGYTRLIEWFHINSKFRVGVVMLVGVWLIAVSFYLQKYFVHFPIENSRQFGYGYKQVIDGIEKVKDQYLSIKLTDQNDPPMLYYLFWANIPPRDVQVYGTNFEEGLVKNLPLDGVKPHRWETKVCNMEEIAKLDLHTIYMVAYKDLPLDFRSEDKDEIPTGIKLIDVIKYPDNEVAYYLITRDTKDGMPVMPVKLTDYQARRCSN